MKRFAILALLAGLILADIAEAGLFRRGGRGGRCGRGGSCGGSASACRSCR